MARKPYESDITQMIRALLVEKPQIVADQQKGRALWWDKRNTQDELRRAEESRVKQKGYVYSNES